MSHRFNLTVACLAALTPLAADAPMTLQFRGTDYVHRWSKAGQNEFTPKTDADLAQWNDMITVNVHEQVRTGEQLAGMANQVMGNYQQRGKILRTDSKPRSAGREAEHLIAAVLGNPKFLEAAFVRCVMVDGVGYATVYSHRVYGEKAGPAMSEWLKANGPQVEAALMGWAKLPPASALRTLPQGK
jgi:hypothetical protein